VPLKLVIVKVESAVLNGDCMTILKTAVLSHFMCGVEGAYQGV